MEIFLAGSFTITCQQGGNPSFTVKAIVKCVEDSQFLADEDEVQVLQLITT
jgi:hypothetical protein